MPSLLTQSLQQLLDDIHQPMTAQERITSARGHEVYAEYETWSANPDFMYSIECFGGDVETPDADRVIGFVRDYVLPGSKHMRRAYFDTVRVKLEGKCFAA